MTFISVDVETSGLTSQYDLLSVGACNVFDIENQIHEVIEPIELGGGVLEWDPGTYEWWISQEAALERLNSEFKKQYPDVVPMAYIRSENACKRFKNWLDQFEKPLFFVAWPASFDYPFIQEWFENSSVENPFSYRTIDVKSYACGKFNVPFDAGHDSFPEWLNEKPEFPHDALSDAIAQAKVFRKLLEQ